MRRGDVKRIYPECTDEQVQGFCVECETAAPKKARIQLSNQNDTVSEKVIIRPSKIKKGVQKIKKCGFKTYVYYQQFGLKKTIERAFVKVTHQDGIEYTNWLKKNQPTEKELQKQKEKNFAYNPKISIVVPIV